MTSALAQDFGSDRMYRRLDLQGMFVFSLALILIGTSTLERNSIATPVGNLYWSQVLALALSPIFFWGNRAVAAVRSVVVVIILISVLSTLGSLMLPAQSQRYALIFQLMLNAYTFVVAFALFRHLDRPRLRRLGLVASVLLFLVAVLQIVGAPGLNRRGTETFGIPRPTLLFTEEGWLGMFAALLLCVCVALQSWKGVFFAGCVALLVDNRGSYILIAAAIAMAVPIVRNNRFLRMSVLAVPLILAAWFIGSALFGMESVFSRDNTVSTRSLDIAAVLDANSGTLLPWGGEQLIVYDPLRSRDLPDTSSAWLIELVWKFGVGGVVIFAAWAWGFVRVLPTRIADHLDTRMYWVVVGTVFVFLCVGQFNNAFGRSWAWVLLGLLFAALATPRAGQMRDSSQITDIDVNQVATGKNWKQPA